MMWVPLIQLIPMSIIYNFKDSNYRAQDYSKPWFYYRPLRRKWLYNLEVKRHSPHFLFITTFLNSIFCLNLRHYPSI